jgi:SEC-C motif-containing protein
MTTCPCGSGAAYEACCGPFHQGAPAPTAVQLMRSRYAAFVLRDAPYLARTCHASLRAGFDAAGLRASFALAWCGLDILAVRGGGLRDRKGMVHFRARWRDLDGGLRAHEERSRFVREDGAWVYLDAAG